MPRPVPRSVFISFLGLGNYSEVEYPDPLGRANIPPAPASPYVQEAFLHYLKLSGCHPEVFIFVTESARRKHYDPPGKLADRLARTDLKHTAVNIDDPGDEVSVWRTFQRVVDIFEPGDHIWFDVTHAFRVLPMLGIVALNYVKALKGVEVEGIWYGDYDPHADPLRAPGSRNVTPFVAIQDWANATRALTERGSVRELTTLSARVLDVNVSGADDSSKHACKAFVNLKRRLTQLAEHLELANANALVGETTWGELIDDFELMRLAFSSAYGSASKPVVDLLDVAERKLAKGANPDARPVAAVKWAAEHGLIQQGFTMLNELAISAVVNRLNFDTTDKFVRDLVSGYLRMSDVSNFEAGRYKLPEAEMERIGFEITILADIEDWRKLLSSITEPRNALSHAGFDRKSGHVSYTNYRRQLDRAIARFEKLL